MNLSQLQELTKDREPWHAAVFGVAKSQTQLSYSKDPAPELYNCFLTAPPLFLQPLPSLISYCLNLPFVTWGRCVFVSSLPQWCPTLCDPMDSSTLGFLVLHYLQELAQTHVKSVMPSNHLIVLSSPSPAASVFPSIRVFSSESALPIRWPKYCSFIVSPSNEYSGLISFRIHWFDLLALQGTL